MNSKDLSALADKLIRGEVKPDRVIVRADGYATSPGRALRDHGIRPTVAFIRNDGWVLSAPAEFADVAEAMWKEHWWSIRVPLPSWMPEPSHN